MQSGLAVFKEIILESAPTSTSVKFEVVTNAFSVEKNKIISDPNFKNLVLDVDFRECIAGES